jgi:hypothetical protein
MIELLTFRSLDSYPAMEQSTLFWGKPAAKGNLVREFMPNAPDHSSWPCKLLHPNLDDGQLLSQDRFRQEERKQAIITV